MRWIQFVLDCLLGQEPGIRSRPGERLRAAVRSESRAGTVSPPGEAVPAWTPARAAAWRARARRTDERAVAAEAVAEVVDAAFSASPVTMKAAVEARWAATRPGGRP